MKNRKSNLTRRDFIKFTAAAGIMPGSLVNLAQAAESSTKKIRVSPDLIKKYPFIARCPYIARSKVIHTHNTGVWKDDNLESGVLRAMLDASITELVRVKNATDAWAALFKPGERIAIKVNAFENSRIWTHAPLVYAVTDSLVDAGIPAERIIIYDILCMFEKAGYKMNKNGHGVRCIKEKSIMGRIKICKTIENCDALINMPVLKSHMITGMTFALKNHFGSISWPAGLHDNIENNISRINADSRIRKRTRLIIGDILEANLKYSSFYPYWRSDYKGDSILMTFDPVAHDTVGLNILERLKTEKGQPFSLKKVANSYLEKSAKLGLGTNQIEKIDLAEINMG